MDNNESLFGGFREDIFLLTLCGIIMIFIFASGYYTGRTDGIEDFVHALRQDKFSHAIESALIKENDDSATSQNQEIDDYGPEEASARANFLFVARLAGFSSRKSAERYCIQLSTKGIVAEIATRGSEKLWYQVITAPRSYEETTAIVERLTKEDHLGNVEIIASQKTE